MKTILKNNNGTLINYNIYIRERIYIEIISFGFIMMPSFANQWYRFIFGIFLPLIKIEFFPSADDYRYLSFYIFWCFGALDITFLFKTFSLYAKDYNVHICSHNETNNRRTVSHLHSTFVVE